MTAYVVWGMGLARAAGIDVRGDTLSRAVDYLRNQLVEEENAPDMLAWMLHALAHADTSADERSDRQRTRLWEMRQKLNPYARALYAIAEHRFGNSERSRILAQNVINGVQEDKENGTVHWGESGIHYRWSEGGVEATAFSISALSQMDPQSAYLEPAVKWMSLNRRGASWKNTRDTAIAILGLTEYLKASKELSPDYYYKVLVNGVTVREGKVDSSNVFSFNRLIDIPADQLRDGDNNVKIIMNGSGALYASAYAKYFTLEEPVTKAGNEIFVTRKYLVQSVKETLMKGYTNDWKPLADGAKVQSGDRIRVEVTMEAKNHYEYLVAEDYKPAGLEAVALTSGPGEAILLDRDGRETQERTPLYQEFRDQKAAFFISKLRQGRHLIRYELRAEIPGVFHVMPNQSHAMYVPEIRANSDEMRIEVNDPADSGKQ
jgi:alpha-2-macroglobulin